MVKYKSEHIKRIIEGAIEQSAEYSIERSLLAIAMMMYNDRYKK